MNAITVLFLPALLIISLGGQFAKGAYTLVTDPLAGRRTETFLKYKKLAEETNGQCASPKGIGGRHFDSGEYW